jgi:hypothetical protein
LPTAPAAPPSRQHYAAFRDTRFRHARVSQACFATVMLFLRSCESSPALLSRHGYCCAAGRWSVFRHIAAQRARCRQLFSAAVFITPISASIFSLDLTPSFLRFLFCLLMISIYYDYATQISFLSRFRYF